MKAKALAYAIPSIIALAAVSLVAMHELRGSSDAAAPSDLRAAHEHLVEEAERILGWSCIGRRLVPGRDNQIPVETLAVVCTPRVERAATVTGWDEAEPEEGAADE